MKLIKQSTVILSIVLLIFCLSACTNSEKNKDTNENKSNVTMGLDDVIKIDLPIGIEVEHERVEENTKYIIDRTYITTDGMEINLNIYEDEVFNSIASNINEFSVKELKIGYNTFYEVTDIDDDIKDSNRLIYLGIPGKNYIIICDIYSSNKKFTTAENQKIDEFLHAITFLDVK